MLWKMLLIMSVHATSVPAPLVANPPVTLNREQVADLCWYVSEKLHGGQPGERRYAFDRYIRGWAGVAGVNEADSEDAEKIRAFWTANAPRLRCSQLGFSVRNGHLWKLAIERNSEDFVEMALIDWGLTPNDLDCSGETPLDYTEREMVRAEGTNWARTLRRYRDLLLEYGGKRASELSAAERTPPDTCP